MNAFRRWMRTAPGYLTLAAFSTALVVAVDPPMQPVFAWLAWTVWLIPLLGGNPRRGCRAPRWLGGR